MKRKVLISMITVLIGIYFLRGSAFPASDKIEETVVTNKIIDMNTLDSEKSTIFESKPGTIVIWVNHFSIPQEIIFIDKKVVFACGSSADFFVGECGTYESDIIPFGGTASLCFMKKGMYEYKIKPAITFSPAEEVKEHYAIIWIK